MNQQIDSAVLLRFKAGDTHAFKMVFDHFYQPIYYFCKKLTGHKEEAEDITIRTFFKLFERCEHFDTYPNIRAFLYITARNNCFDYLRSLKWQHQKQRELVEKMQDEHLLQYEYEIEAELLEAVRAAINDLPDTCRKIFRMLYYDELKPVEIAQHLNISVDTVYSQKRRALQILRMALVENQMVLTSIIYLALYMQFAFLGD